MHIPYAYKSMCVCMLYERIEPMRNLTINLVRTKKMYPKSNINSNLALIFFIEHTLTHSIYSNLMLWFNDFLWHLSRKVRITSNKKKCSSYDFVCRPASICPRMCACVCLLSVQTYAFRRGIKKCTEITVKPPI